DVIDAALEVHVAGLRIRPGVEDGDDRPVLPLLRCVTHLHRTGAVAEGAEVVGRKPARAAQLFRPLGPVDHVWGPHFLTGFRSMVGKIRFSTIRPMMITVNRPANTAGMSSKLRFSKMYQPRPPCPDETPNTSSAAISVRQAKAQPIFRPVRIEPNAAGMRIRAT